MKPILVSSFAGCVLFLSIVAAGPMVLRPDGIEFTDGTVQTTAASTLRRYYVTNFHVDALEAPGACATG